MKTCLQLAAAVAVLLRLGVAAAEVAEGGACPIDEPGQSKPHSYRLVLESLQPCLKATLAGDALPELKTATTLANFREFFRDFCPHLARVNACVDEVSANLSTCRNEEVAVPLRIAADLAEHVLAAGCEDGGRRLAHIAHKVVTVMLNKEQQVPLRQCVLKVSALLNIASDADIDLTSESFLMYQEARNYMRCWGYVSDEAYRSALEWLVNEVVSVLKCRHPRDGRLVLCSSLDSSEVPATNICQVKPFNETNLYDQLEQKVFHCYFPIFTLDLQEGVDVTDLEWLKENYRSRCFHREISECVLEKAVLAESCLPREEDRQFQLFLEAVEDAVRLVCVEDEGRTAAFLREVHRLTPERGHAMRECYRSVSEAGVSHHQGSANLRFYHNLVAFRQCLVEKFKDNSGVVKDVETAINEVLKRMKCVGPEDDTTVLCETLIN